MVTETETSVAGEVSQNLSVVRSPVAKVAGLFWWQKKAQKKNSVFQNAKIE